MHRARLITLLSVLSALVWATLVLADVTPSQYSDYRRSALQAAESAHNAARTGWLAGRQELAGAELPTVSMIAFDDATRALAGASEQFASETPPDVRSRGLRDELSPLLAADVSSLGDAAAAVDDSALREAVAALDRVDVELVAFIEAHR